MDENGQLQEYALNTNNASIDTSIFASAKYLPLKSDTNKLEIIDVKNNNIIDLNVSNIDNPKYLINIYEVYKNNILVIKSNDSMKYADETYLITITK